MCVYVCGRVVVVMMVVFVCACIPQHTCEVRRQVAGINSLSASGSENLILIVRLDIRCLYLLSYHHVLFVF